MLEMNTCEFVLLQNFVKKQKCLNLEPKMPFWGIFHQKCCILVLLSKNLKKKLFSYLKSASLNLSIGKISQKKQKCLNSAPKIPYLVIFGVEF